MQTVDMYKQESRYMYIYIYILGPIDKSIHRNKYVHKLR